MEPINPGERQSHSLKPGDKMRFINQSNSAIRIRVTTACGTQTETELHPGALFHLTAGSASADVELLPPEQAFSGLVAV